MKTLSFVSGVVFSVALFWATWVTSPLSAQDLAPPESPAAAPSPAAPTPASTDERSTPDEHVASVPAEDRGASRMVRRVSYEEPAAGEHPLTPTLRVAREGLKRLEAIKDYSANLVRRERIDGKLKDYDYQYLKVRHEPFSVYTYFQAPKKGSEILYVAGKNEGQLLAHEVGAAAQLVGTVALDVNGPRARKESKYPISQAGLMNLTKRVIDMCERDSRFGECEVKVFPDAKVNGRSCLCVQVTHPTARRDFRFHIGRIYFDNELGFTTRYEAYAWPQRAEAEPPLLEEYTFVDLKFDNGFTDADFDAANPSYNFPRSR